jgi:PAS domain S-box-containing protein
MSEPIEDRSEHVAELLRERDEHLRLIIESATDFAIFTLDLGGRIISWNVGAERILGYTQNEVLGKHVSIIFTPEDVAKGRIEFEMGSALYEGRENDDRWHMRKGGVRFWANGMMMPLKDKRGESCGYLKILRDRTEQKLASERLRATEERLGVAVDGASLGLWHCDLRSGALVWNDRAKSHFGFPPETKGAYNILFEHVAPEDSDRTREAVNHAITGHTTFDAEFRTESPDGQTQWIHAIGRSVADEFGEPCRVDGVTIDISERMQREAAFEDAAQRRDEFLAMLAHELRNPLAAINNALQVWLYSDRAEHANWSKGVLVRQTKHLTRLIDDLVDVSRITRGTIELQKQRVDIMALVNRAVESVKPLVDQKRLTLTVPAGMAGIDVLVDPARIEQVVVNLLTNAVQNTDEAGHVGLTVEAGSEVIITISDDGNGIPADMLGQVFDPFVQVNPALDRSQGGLGIGLTLVKTLIELHGGTVSAASEGTGKGSQFRFRLPARAKAADETSPPDHASLPEPAKAWHRVLVVEDNRDTAAGLIKLLNFSGYHVIAAHDGPAAIELAKLERPDAIFMDIGLPGMDGYRVAEALRKDECCAETLLVAVSSYGREQDIKRSHEAGFDHHLVKPVDVKLIFSLLASRSTSAQTPATPNEPA